MGEQVTVDTVINITTNSGVATVNENLGNLADEFDAVLYRDGRATVEGNIDMDSNRILNLPAAVNNTEPLRKAEADEAITAMNAALVLVEGLGYSIIEPVYCASVPGEGNVTLSGDQTVGGIDAPNGARILVTDQTDPAANGIYVKNTGGAWLRATDFNETSEVVYLSFVPVQYGNNVASMLLMTEGTIVVGTTPQEWVIRELRNSAALRAELAEGTGDGLIGLGTAYTGGAATYLSDITNNYVTFSRILKGVTQANRHTALNDALAELAADNKTIYGDDGDWGFEGQILIPSYAKVIASPNCKILKAFDSALPFVRTYNEESLDWLGDDDMEQTANHWSWEGGYFAPLEQVPGGLPTMGSGRLFDLHGLGWKFKNAVVRDWGGDGINASQAFVFGGGNFELSGVDARSTQDEVGTGTFRCVWVEQEYPAIISNLFGEGGDDIFQFVPNISADPDDSPANDNSLARYFFGKSIYDTKYANCRGHSHAARLMACAVGYSSNSYISDSSIINCGFDNVHGQGTARAIVVGSDQGSSTSRVYNINFNNCSILGQNLDTAQPQAIWLDNTNITGATGTVDRIIFNNVVLTGTACENGMGIYGVTDVQIRNSVITGESTALDIDTKDTNLDASTVYIEKSTLTSVTGDQNMIDIGHIDVDQSTVLTFGEDVTITKIGTGKDAIYCRSANATVTGVRGGVAAYKTAGATNTGFLNCYTTGPYVEIDGHLAGTVDAIPGPRALDTYHFRRRIGIRKQTYNAAGIPSLAGSGAIQNLATVTITGAAVGDKVILSPDKVDGTEFWAAVTATNTVTITQRNSTGAPVDVGATTFRIEVWRTS